MFSSSSEADVTYLEDIAKNNALLKIDLGQTTLAHSAEDYKVDSVPFVVVLHRGEEILREKPSSTTAEKIEKLVKEKEEANAKEINPTWTVHPERKDGVEKNDEKTDKDVHHHPKPLVIVPDFGHLGVNEPSESPLISSRPIQDLDTKTGANLITKPQPPPIYSTEQDKLLKFENSIKESPVQTSTSAPSSTSTSPSTPTHPSSSVRSGGAVPRHASTQVASHVHKRASAPPARSSAHAVPVSHVGHQARPSSVKPSQSSTVFIGRQLGRH